LETKKENIEYIIRHSYAEDSIDIDEYGVRFYATEYLPGTETKVLTGVTLEERLALRFDDVKVNRLTAKDRLIIVCLSFAITLLIGIIAFQIYNFAKYYGA
jgi:hypothetical protein